MDWHWDERKAKANLTKHGISFELAKLVFDDPFHQTVPDDHEDGNRWNTVGMVDVKTVFVVHTYFDDDMGGRIISARKATAYERKTYLQGRNH